VRVCYHLGRFEQPDFHLYYGAGLALRMGLPLFPWPNQETIEPLAKFRKEGSIFVI